MLWKSIAQLLDGYTLKGRMKLMLPLPATGSTPDTNSFYDHGQIKILKKDLTRLPSYIPAANFALAIMDMIAKKAPVKTGTLFNDFQAGLQTFAGSKGDLHEVLRNLAATSVNIKELQDKIETWFNSYMNRVTGWYESHTVVTVRLIAIAVTLIFNINVIKLTKKIYNDDTLRSNLVTIAEKVAADSSSISSFYSKAFDNDVKTLDSVYAEKLSDTTITTAQKNSLTREKQDSISVLAEQYTQKQIAGINALTSQLESAGLPLGWKGKSWKDNIDDNLLLALIGWIIGACCISMGAPFWFDMLGKLVNVRRSGVKPGK
jgi:hypothetical protein